MNTRTGPPTQVANDERKHSVVFKNIWTLLNGFLKLLKTIEHLLLPFATCLGEWCDNNDHSVKSVTTNKMNFYLTF